MGDYDITGCLILVGILLAMFTVSIIAIIHAAQGC